MSAPALPSRTSAPSRDSGPAGAIWYGLLVFLGAKALRAMDLAAGSASSSPYEVLPYVLGPDLFVVVGLGLVAHALPRGRRGAKALLGLILAGCGALLAIEVMSHRLTGVGVTWQRLRGDEGATLADLNLLSTEDFAFGALLLGLALLLVPVALALGARLRALAWAGRWPALAGLALAGSLSLGAKTLKGDYVCGLDDNAVLVLALSALLPADQKEAPAQSELLTGAQWELLHRPSRSIAEVKLPHLPDEKLKNVVVILAEGVPYRYTSFGAAGKDTTPRLKERAEREGLLFDRFYAHFHSSIQSIFSLVCSAYPPMYVRDGNVVAKHPRIDCGELSEKLSGGGLDVGLFHGGRFAYYDKLALLGGRGYDVAHDAETLHVRDKKRSLGKWGIDDRALVDATLEWIDELPAGQRFGALLIPITAHYPYTLPRDVKPAFPGEEKANKFASAVHYLDATVDSLIRGLEERGLYEDTLVVYLADHGERVDALATRLQGFRVHYQQNLHVPLVLLNPRLFGAKKEPWQSPRPGGVIDVLPTVLDALGLERDPRHLGHSLLAPDYAPRRVFFGSFHSAKTLVGFAEGDTKFILQLQGRETELYDLNSDPDELHDLSSEQPGVVEAFSKDVLAFYRANQAYFLKMPAIADERETHERVVQSARVTLEDPAEACVLEGDAWRCASLTQAALQQQRRRVDHRNSRCLEIALPPPGQSLRVRIEGDVLPFLSGVRVGVADRDKKGATGAATLRVFVDDEAAGEAKLKGHLKMTWIQLRRPDRSLDLLLSRHPNGPQRLCVLLSDSAWRAIERPEGPLPEELLEQY
jgi:hypothetical protein